MSRHTDIPAPIPSPAHDDAGARMVDAAIGLLGEHPGASMRELAVASGVGRATLYRHFATRDELVRAIRLRALRDCREALDPALLEKGSAREALAVALAALLPVLDRYRVLLDAAPPDRTDAEQRELVDAIEAPLLDLIRRGQEAGELDPDLPADFTLAVLTGVLRAARAAVASGGMTAGEAHPLAVRTLLTGIGAPQRRRAAGRAAG